MRKYIPITVALAIVSVFAVAIVASGEVLSFNSDDTHAVNDVPSNQSQPQDFAGAGSRLYHFGPDYMCLIYTTSTVECFGSDEHGIVSNVPTVTGFTNIDGGDNYACAFNETVEFSYCWGAITRNPTTSPPTAQPTVAPTVQPTAEPTATIAPGGTVVPTETPAATPVATATAVPTQVPTVVATATPVPNPCRILLPTGGTLPVTLTSSWIAECVYPRELEDVAAGDRYYRYVAFSATLAASWVATLESNEDTVLVLFEWDDGNEEWAFVEMNDDRADGDTNSRIEWNAILGQEYLLAITTYEATTLGDFTLTLDAEATSSQGSSRGQIMEHSNIPFERRQ